MLVADDHAIVREGLQTYLGLQAGIEVVGVAGNGEDAVSLAVERRPHVALMDIDMPGMTGIEATARIRRDAPLVTVIAFTGMKDPITIEHMSKAGASAVIMKATPPEDISDILQAVHHGAPFPATQDAWRLTQPRSETLLTSRELEVLAAVTHGKSSREIALDLGISRRTVDKHRDNIMRKVNVRGVAVLTSWALRHGLVAPS